MYSIQDKFDNAIDVLSYTISAMKDSGYLQCDIDEFLRSSIGNGNYNLLLKSLEMIDECNKVEKDNLLYDSELDSLYDEDFEAYEGFDSCSKRFYNSNEYGTSDYEDNCDYCPFDI